MDTGDDLAVADLRRRVAAYLHRHSTEDSDVGAAELAVSELLSNVKRHAGPAGWISIGWSGEVAVLTVVDLGPGFDLRAELPGADAIGGRGLFIVSQLGQKLQGMRRAAGGSVVSVELPVRRPVETQIDSPRRRVGILPSTNDATPSGFGRDVFLLAVAVQLAQAIEEQRGPDAAAAAVAQVGADVGGQMELEYRIATGTRGPLTAEHLAECFVRLKSAIDGGFFPLEVSESRIVLGNTRCPFGDVVQRAPSLCRMTSSVFGSIAASATLAPVTVDLEERIAIGDSACRVVIDLTPAPNASGNWYRPPQAPSGDAFV
ncbi:MAG: ATP-binding protein [Acidimicrobiales bacterium]